MWQLCGGGRPASTLPVGPRTDYAVPHASITVLAGAPASLLRLARGVARIAGRFLLCRESCLPLGLFRYFKLGLGCVLGLLFGKPRLLFEFLRLALGGARLAGLGCVQPCSLPGKSGRIVLRFAFGEFPQRRFLGLCRRFAPLAKVFLFKGSHPPPFRVFAAI